MLSRSHRFHGYGSVRAVYRQGKAVRGQHIGVKCVQNGRKRTYQVAVVVSKKVHKSAVVRNRIRRRIYEAVRTSEVPIADGTDIVFTVFSDRVAEMEPAKLRAAVDDLLQKVAAATAQTAVDRGIVGPKGS